MNPQIGFLLNKSLESLRNSNFESAELYLKQALRLQSNNPHVLRMLGVISAQRRQYADALKYLNGSLKALPKNPLTLSNLGNVYLELKEYANAVDAYERSLKIDPRYEEAWSNKANVFYQLKRFDEALAHYDKALSLKPDYAEAWSNKGWALNELEFFDEALAHYDKALSLKPDYAEAWSNKGYTLKRLKRFDDAVIHFEKALTIKPDIDWTNGGLVDAKMNTCSWSDFVNSLEIISQKVMTNERVVQPFSLLALSDDSLLHKKCAEIYIQSKFSINDILGPISKHPQSQKIRIGYFSADFKNHPVSQLIAELFEIHDRSKFEIYAFSLAASNDEMRGRLSKAFDQFIDVETQSDIQIAELTRSLGIDIAVDLTGLTADARTGIFSYRAAPIQVNYLGYPGTTGADYMDYIIADQILIPPETQSCYSEKVVYLPNSYQVNDRKRTISDRQFTRRELELPENGFVFCCFNNSLKILPSTFASWMRILKGVEDSVLWLFQDNPGVADNLKREALKYGIDPMRLVFAKRMPLPEHLARHSKADLFIDTLPYNAHTTTSDALWAGLPILTIIGQSFAGRVASSLLNAIGLSELIVNTQEEYEAMAIELAANPKKLAGIKLKLANNRLTTPLFDTPLFAKNLETAYIKMYERCQADLKPDHIYIV